MVGGKYISVPLPLLVCLVASVVVAAIKDLGGFVFPGILWKLGFWALVIYFAYYVVNRYLYMPHKAKEAAKEAKESRAGRGL